MNIKQLFKCNWTLLIPILGAILLILCAGPSVILMKKVVAYLILPVGILWILLAMVAAWPRIRLLPRLFFIAIWVLFTICGNPLFGSWIIRTLEKPYVSFANPEEPLDVVLVLGGATGKSLAETTQVGTAGDRVVTSARLYNRGLIKQLITSGRSVTEVGADRDLTEETIEIWGELGIPTDQVIRFPKPRTTEEEMAALKVYLDGLPQKPARVGICTSAWHLKRAQKQWQSQGIEAIPVPADFRSRPIPIIPQYLIPQRRGFNHVQIALWEYLGILLN